MRWGLKKWSSKDAGSFFKADKSLEEKEISVRTKIMIFEAMVMIAINYCSETCVLRKDKLHGERQNKGKRPKQTYISYIYQSLIYYTLSQNKKRSSFDIDLS